VGTKAEDLEKAAKSGNLEFVRSNHDGFIQTARKIIADIAAMFQNISEENPRPKKHEPDASVLAALAEACGEYDIDGVDRAMEELEKYDYESRAELVEWLRNQVNVMGFNTIQERLSHS
jgi:hypothetical protein